MKIGHLGPRGTFSEEAAVLYFEGEMQRIAYATVPEVIEDVSIGALDAGIIPLENTIEGSINFTLDSLSDYENVHMVGEYILKVSLQLLGIPGATLSSIQEVWSISPAMAQCFHFIRQIGASRQFCESTATAARLVKEANDTTKAAVASAFAAKEFGLTILAKDIQDVAMNHTRFAVISKEPNYDVMANKTMLLIAPSKEQAGMLANILQVFATLDLNLVWIESRPTKTRLGTYQFYMEVMVGHRDERLKKAIAILEILGNPVRVIGSYIGACVSDIESFTV